MPNIILNNSFEVFYDTDINKYIIKDIEKKIYFKLDSNFYKIFCKYAENRVLLLEDVIEVFGSDKAEIIYNKFNSFINSIYSKKDTSKKIDFKRLNKSVNFAYKYMPSLFFSKKFIVTSFLISCVLLVFLLYNLHNTSIIYVKNHFLLNISWLTINVFFHELGHAFTILHFDREIISIGFKMDYYMPFFYVRTTDIVMCEKYKKILVSLAGPFVSVLLGGISTIIYILFKFDFVINLAMISYLFGIINVLPLFNFDGYHLLCDLLNEENLRKNSFKYVRNFCNAKVPIKKAIIYIVFFAFSVASILYIIINILYKLYSIWIEIQN